MLPAHWTVNYSTEDGAAAVEEEEEEEERAAGTDWHSK